MAPTDFQGANGNPKIYRTKMTTSKIGSTKSKDSLTSSYHFPHAISNNHPPLSTFFHLLPTPFDHARKKTIRKTKMKTRIPNRKPRKTHTTLSPDPKQRRSLTLELR